MWDMGIIKVEVNFLELKESWVELRKHRGRLFQTLSDELRGAATSAINQIMNSEMSVFLGKPDQSENKRNGYETKTYSFKGIGAIELRMPVDRHRKFESAIIPKHERIDPRIKEDLAVLHLAGISTRVLSKISKRVLGVQVGKDQVSESLEIIEEKALSWLERPLTEKYWALYIDGTNFHLQRKGTTQKEPSLVVLGVNAQNRRSILAIVPGCKDDARTWESCLSGLITRGLDPKTVQIGIMDGLTGLESVFKSVFPQAQTARCWVHAKNNAMAKCPARFREAFEKCLEKVMYAVSESEARGAFYALKETFSGEAERAIRCIEKDLDSLLVHYRFEKRYWLALKTTNPIERVNRELKRRTKSMGTVGEKTLECLQAFTALRLEMNWRQVPIDSERLKHLQFIKPRVNQQASNELEEVITTLLQ
jgi:transposase-like protein